MNAKSLPWRCTNAPEAGLQGPLDPQVGFLSAKLPSGSCPQFLAMLQKGLRHPYEAVAYKEPMQTFCNGSSHIFSTSTPHTASKFDTLIMAPGQVMSPKYCNPLKTSMIDICMSNRNCRLQSAAVATASIVKVALIHACKFRAASA